MTRTRNVFAAFMVAAAASCAVAGAAFAQEPAEVGGVITANDGTTVTVRNADGDHRVNLTGTTTIRGTTGMLNVRGSDHPSADLIPGLTVSVEGVQDSSGITAGQVTFKEDDLRTARAIAGGMAGTEARVAENSERIDNAGQLVQAGRTKVFFEVGSATLSNEGKASLDAIATQARGLNTAYRFAVVGRADPTGNAAANERLSQRRAQAVIQYLQRSAGITPDKFLLPAALGSAPVAQDPDVPQNDAEARRVTVTLAISASARQQ
jgi:outer membrane protein OmpA-like peptidoglycan-associated protein